MREIEKIETAKRLIKKLYQEDGCSVGGYGHIVFDDNNVEDGFIDWCIIEAQNGTYEHVSESGRIKCIEALKYFKTLTEDERYIALGIESDDDQDIEFIA